jgi:Ca2+-binding RTX toxin-like protein
VKAVLTSSGITGFAPAVISWYVPTESRETAIQTLEVRGGSGDDTITVQGTTAGTQTAVNGGDGNDILWAEAGLATLSGSRGRDLLIAGPGGGRLDGGEGEDILVGGITAYDSNPAALTAIMAEWARTDLPCAARVDHLLYGGGLNGSSLLNLSTFTSNGSQNTVIGAAELDLFYGSLARDTNDRDASIGEVFVEPDGVRGLIQVDARALGVASLGLDGVAHDATAPFSIHRRRRRHHRLRPVPGRPPVRARHAHAGAAVGP